MKKAIIILLFGLFTITGAVAQDYDNAVGLRAGFSTGLTVKHFTGPTTALEGILSTRWSGFAITGLLEFHYPAFDVDRLNWYWGFGGHIGFWDGNDNPWLDDNKDYTVIGIDGIIGIEYNFGEAPVNISVDWKPGFNLVGYSNFWGDEGAISLRYYF